jgi:ribonuclease HII
MHRAVELITLEYSHIIVDGNYNYLSHDPRATALIKADDSIPAVSAASIMAKVARDAFMAQLAGEYPDYGFDKHVGYGTKQHTEALLKYGVTTIHRRSYKPVGALL